MNREALLKLFAEIPAEITVAVFGEYNTGCGDCEVSVWTGKKYVRPDHAKPYWVDTWETIAYRGPNYSVEKIKNFKEVLDRALIAARHQKEGEMYDGK